MDKMGSKTCKMAGLEAQESQLRTQHSVLKTHNSKLNSRVRVPQSPYKRNETIQAIDSVSNEFLCGPKISDFCLPQSPLPLSKYPHHK